MDFTNLCRNMSANNKTKVTENLQKLCNNQSINAYTAKEICDIMRRENPTVNDNKIKECVLKLYACALNLDSKGVECLKKLQQSRQTVANLNPPECYYIVMKIAKTINFTLDFFRPLNYLNDFFNEITRNSNHKKYFETIERLGLSEGLTVELFKAHYQPEKIDRYKLDALIKILGKEKLFPQLPEKSFHAIIDMIGRKLQLSPNKIELLKKIEKSRSTPDAKDITAFYSNTDYQTGDIQYLPLKTRCKLEEKHRAANVGEMNKYFQKIAPLIASHPVPKIIEYERILVKIEKGNVPTESELSKLDNLYYTVEKANKLGDMPNRSEAFLRNYNTEKELKRVLPNKDNVHKLLKKCINNEKLSSIEAIYLNLYLNKVPNIPTPVRHIIYQCLNHLPSDIQQAAKQIQELIDPKLLKVLEQVIKEIRAEEYRLSNRKFYVKELGLYIKFTSQFMEIRLNKKKYRQKILKEIETLRGKSAGEIGLAFEKFPLQYHKGVDFSGHYEKDGTIKYQHGFKVKPKIATVLKLYKDPNPFNNYITILEYHPEHGMLLTKFRHVQKFYVAEKKNIVKDDNLGTYQKMKNKTKEHSHIEKRIVKKADLETAIVDKFKEEFEKMIQKQENSFKEEGIKKDVQKLIDPLLQGDERQAIALFTPGSHLSKQLLASVEQKWRNHAGRILQEENIGTANEIFKKINEPIVRDQFILETIVQILIKLKLLLEQSNRS